MKRICSRQIYEVLMSLLTSFIQKKSIIKIFPKGLSFFQDKGLKMVSQATILATLVFSSSCVSYIGTPAQSSTTGVAMAPGVSTQLGNYNRKIRNMYSVVSDIKLGEQVMAEQVKQLQNKKIPVNPESHKALKARLDKIVARLAAISDYPTFPYEVTLIDKTDINNAYSLPGGKFGVYTGLFDKEKGLINEKSDDEIAAVMAHEMAHATLRHVTRRMTTMTGISLFGTAVSISLSEGVGVPARNMFDEIFYQGLSFYIPHYSRGFETEADRVGLYYMSLAGYNPQAAVDVWKRAASKGGKNSNQTDFGASHPASGERALKLETWLPEAMKLYQAAKNKK